MTEEQYNYYAKKVYDANEYKHKIDEAESMLKRLELGEHIQIIVGTYGVHKELSVEEIVKVKLIVTNHYQQKLEEYKKKLEEL